MKFRDFFVIAHNIRSLHNVGSIFRTADAFGVTSIYLTGYTGRPDNTRQQQQIAKTALGAEVYVPWHHQQSATRVIAFLRKTIPGITIVALENNVKADPLSKLKLKGPIALILGEEVGGVSKSLLNLCDTIVEIPMVGKKESLNVSVAFGIAAYAITKVKQL